MGKGGELGAREVCKDEGKEDGRILARFAACVASRVGIEGLWRGQEEMVMSYWGDHGYFVDGTPEGQASNVCGRGRAVAGQLGKKRILERWRRHHAWTDIQGRDGREGLHKSDEMMHGDVEIA